MVNYSSVERLLEIAHIAKWHEQTPPSNPFAKGHEQNLHERVQNAASQGMSDAALASVEIGRRHAGNPRTS